MLENMDVYSLNGVAKEDQAFDVRFEVKAVQVNAVKWEDHIFMHVAWDNGQSSRSQDLDDGSEKAEEYKSRWRPLYEQFLKTRKNAPIGYPLEKFFEAEPSKARMYASMEIYTVEQLAAQPEGNLSKCGLEGPKDAKSARAFVECMKQSAVIQPVVAEMTALKLRQEELQKQNAELLARLEAKEAREAEAEEPIKRGPGRPKKDNNDN